MVGSRSFLFSQSITNIIQNHKPNHVYQFQHHTYIACFIRLVIFCFSLRPMCFLESTKLKNAAYRAVRHYVKTEEHVDILIKLKYDFLIAR